MLVSTVDKVVLSGIFELRSLPFGRGMLLAVAICIGSAVMGCGSNRTAEQQGHADSAVTPASTDRATYSRAVLIERYDEHGEWRAVARKIELTGPDADRLGRLFPELGKTLKPLEGSITEAPM